MRVLRVHAPGTPAAVADAVGRAAVEFNKGLDIRLRFLSIGIEETVLSVADADDAGKLVLDSLARSPADAVVLLGDGQAALAAATAASKAGAALVRIGGGRRDGATADAARAIDRLASLVVVEGAAQAAALDAEGVTAARADVGPLGDPTAAEKIVRAVSRARRQTGGR